MHPSTAPTAATAGTADPFRALEDDVIGTGWAADQTRDGQRWLSGLDGRDVVRRWIERLYHPEYRSPPTARPTGLFRLRLLPGANHPSLVLTDESASDPPDQEPREQVLVDPDDFGPRGRSYLTAWQVCPRGRWLAFQVCRDGAEHDDLWLRDLAAGTPARRWVPALRRPSVAFVERPDSGTTGGYTGRWTGIDGLAAGLWYCPLTGEPVPVWRPPDATEVTAAGDGGCYLTVTASPDGHWLLISARYGADVRNEVWLAPRPSPDGLPLTPERVIDRGAGPVLTRFGPDGLVYVAAEALLGPGALASFAPGRSDRADWRPVIATRPGAAVASFAIAPGWVAVTRNPTTGPELAVAARPSGPVRTVPLPGVGGTLANLIADPNAARFWFEYSDHVRPRTVYAVEPESAMSRVLSDPRADSTALPEIRSMVETYRSDDGTEVDLTVVVRADRVRRGVPTILTAYGGFGRSVSVGFRSDVLVWVLAGGLYAIAHVRGGGEKGAAWHEAGRGRHKPAAVADLVAAGRHLVHAGWTGPGRLAVFGASNGGLLATAAAVRAPDLFAACVANAAVTDLVRYTHLGDGAAWRREYGDPDDPDDLAAIRSYSPYQNVRPGVAYPAFLLTCGRGDVRVPPAHSYKLCAAVGAATTSDPDERPVLLLQDEHAGHGIRTVDARIDAFVDRITFLARQLHLPLTTLEDLRAGS